MSKQKSLLIVGLSLIAIAIVGGTSAYFATTDRAHNIVTTSSVSIEIIETSLDGSGREVPFENIKNALPGKTYSKIPRIKNTDETPAWARICPSISVRSQTNEPLPVPNNVLTIDFNSTDWEKFENCYYYTSALGPNETTTPLFTAVKITNDLEDAYQNAKFNLTLTAEAVQATNNGNSAQTAGGWNE